MIISNFIVFEGIDGSGTTTQARLLKDRMGDSLAVTAEPTNGDVGRFLRRILGGKVQVDTRTLAYLFAADRAEHLYGKGGITQTLCGAQALCGIAPSVTVLSDRYLFSSIVYQGTAVGAGGESIARVINAPFPLPELLFYFRIDGAEAFRRVKSRGGQREIFETPDTLTALSAKYDEVIAEYDRTPLGSGMRVITLDATQSAPDLSQQVWRYVSLRQAVS